MIRINNYLKSICVLLALCSFRVVLSSSTEGDLLKYAPEATLEGMPSEVKRMFLEHMTPEQRGGVSRVSKIWHYLGKTFPDDIPLKPKIDKDNVIIIEGEEGWKKALDISNKQDGGSYELNLDDSGDLKAIPNDYKSVFLSENIASIAINFAAFPVEFLRDLLPILVKKNNYWGLTSNNYWGQASYQDFLNDAIKQSPKLVWLEFDSMSCSDEQFGSLMESIANKTGEQIVSFGLENTNLTDDTMLKIHNWLEKNAAIKSLHLRTVSLNDQKLQELVEKLSPNLEILNLSGNDITLAGIINSLKVIGNSQNSKIREISFASNAMRSVPVKDLIELAKAINNCKSLQVLDLFNGKTIWTEEQTGALVNALESNKNLLQLNIKNNRVSASTKKKLDEILERNRRAAELGGE